MCAESHVPHAYAIYVCPSRTTYLTNLKPNLISTLQVDSTKSTLTNFVLIALLIILTDGLKKLAEVWKC